MADDVQEQGPLGTTAGQLLQRGMNFLFAPKPKQLGMVAPKPVAPVAQAPIQQSVAPPAQLPQPSLDTRSGYNVNTYVDRVVEGRAP